MQPEGVGVRQPEKLGPFQLRLKFGKQAYRVVELQHGEEAAEVAKKLRKLAAHWPAGRIFSRSKVLRPFVPSRRSAASEPER